MSARSRTTAASLPVRQPVRQFDDHDEQQHDDHDQYDDDYYQPQPLPQPARRSSRPAQARRPPPPTDATEYYDELVPAPVKQRKSVLSPSSMATFDPLSSPPVNDRPPEMKRTKLKTSSVYSFDAANDSAGNVSDGFDLRSPPPPAYHEVVLADDDVIAAQFNRMTVAGSSSTANTNRITRRPSPANIMRVDPDVEAEAERALAEALGQPLRKTKPVAKPQQPRRSSPAAAAAQYDDDYQHNDDSQYEDTAPTRVRRTATSSRARRSPAIDDDEIKEPTATIIKPNGIIQAAPISFEDDEPVVAQRPQTGRIDRPAQPPPQVARALSIPVRGERAQPQRRPVANENADGDDADYRQPRAGDRKKLPARAQQQMVKDASGSEDDGDQQTRERLQSNVRRMKSSSAALQSSRPVKRATPRVQEELEEDDDITPTNTRTKSNPRASPTSSQSQSRPKSIRVDALAFMKAGTPFLKYGSGWMSVPHFRLLSLSSDNSSIVWFSANKSLSETRIPIANIDSILLGQSTPGFAKHKSPELESNSFSILYTSIEGKNKSLDLTSKDMNEMNIWIDGLTKMMQLLRNDRALASMKRCLFTIDLVYGGAPSQDIVDYDTKQIVDVRKKSTVQKIIEQQWKRKNADYDSDDDAESGTKPKVDASLYASLHPRFQSLQDTLVKHREKLREAPYTNCAEYSVMASIVQRVEVSVRKISDWMMDGELELADQEIWRAQVDLEALENVFKAIKGK